MENTINTGVTVPGMWSFVTCRIRRFHDFKWNCHQFMKSARFQVKSARFQVNQTDLTWNPWGFFATEWGLASSSSQVFPYERPKSAKENERVKYEGNTGL